MNKKIRKIIEEEIENQVEKINLSSPKEVSKVIKELFTFSTDSFLKNIGSQEAVLDKEADLPQENWEWLLGTVNESYNNDTEEWNKKFKDQKLKILCYKYFTKQEFIELDTIEKNLKIDIKKYFTALQNFSDLKDFEDKFFNLPFETLNSLVRYILNKSGRINKEIKISKEELKKKIKELKDERLKMVKKLSLISKKYQDTFDITKMKELYENGLFFEDNLINRAVNEYMVKLLNNKTASEKIKDTLNSAILLDLKFHSENSVSYINHFDSLRKEETEPYFTAKGFQIGTRFDNEIEISENKDKQQDYIVDKDSRLKEPSEKIASTTFPSEKTSNTDIETGDEGTGGAAGSSGGSGGGASPSIQSGAGVGLPGGGGFSDAPPDLEPGDLEASEGDESETEDSEMPKDENGLPVDFGTPETNPEGTEEEK